ncbi:MAG: hypothetical protein AB2417_00550 [Clostridiaceae bacterium]
MEKSLQEQQVEALKTADEYIVKLISGINICIDNIKENKKDEAMDLISYIVDGIEWLNEVAKLTKDIQKENMNEEIMKEQLQKIPKYLNIEDYNKISKLLYKEILPLLSTWEDIIKQAIVF